MVLARNVEALQFACALHATQQRSRVDSFATARLLERVPRGRAQRVGAGARGAEGAVGPAAEEVEEGEGEVGGDHTLHKNEAVRLGLGLRRPELGGAGRRALHPGRHVLFVAAGQRAVAGTARPLARSSARRPGGGIRVTARPALAFSDVVLAAEHSTPRAEAHTRRRRASRERLALPPAAARPACAPQAARLLAPPSRDLGLFDDAAIFAFTPGRRWVGGRGCSSPRARGRDGFGLTTFHKARLTVSLPGKERGPSRTAQVEAAAKADNQTCSIAQASIQAHIEPPHTL